MPERTPQLGDENLARAMALARRIERSAGLVQRARSHAKGPGRATARKKARRQLKKLASALEQRQEVILDEGLDPALAQAMSEALDAWDAELEQFLSAKPRKAALKLVSKRAKALRKSL